MAARVNRQTVDLSTYPDLVVLYLGMRVRTPRGMVRFLKIGREIGQSVAAGPDGLLKHEMYTMRGAMEGVYDDMPSPLGLGTFAPLVPVRGRMFGARSRLSIEGTAPAPIYDEDEL
jgi:hypothetical protein